MHETFILQVISLFFCERNNKVYQWFYQTQEERVWETPEIEGEANFRYLEDLCNKGLIKRYGSMPQEAKVGDYADDKLKERLDYEADGKS